MNKNTSPQSRSAPRSRASVRGRGGKATSPSAERIAHKAGAEAKARRTAAPTTMAGRIRRMLLTVAIPNVVIILAIVVVAIGALLLTSSPMAWLPTIVAESWMVFNLAPVTAGGVTLEFVPLLPALLLGGVVGQRIRQAIKHKVSINDLIVLTVCVFAVPLLLTIVAWLMLWDAGKVYDVSPPKILAVLPRMLLLHLVALVGGMGTRLWKALAKRFTVPRELVDAARTAIRYLTLVAAAAAVLVIIMWIVGWGRQSEMLAEYPILDGVGKVVLFLISLLYLPNAVVGVGGIISGSEFHFGPASSISLFDVHLVALPPLPISAIVPGSVDPWAVALLALPLIAALWVLIRSPKHITFTFVGAGTLTVAVTTLIASYFTHGELGYYGSTGLNLWTSAALSALWFGAVGVAVAAAFALSAWRMARNAPSLPAALDDAAPAEAETGPEAESRSGSKSGSKPETEAEASEAADTSVADGTVEGEVVGAETGDETDVESYVETGDETDAEAEAGDAAEPEAEIIAADAPIDAEVIDEVPSEAPDEAVNDVSVAETGEATEVAEDTEATEDVEQDQEFPASESKD